MLGVGWRTVLLQLDDEPTPALVALLDQIVEVAAFHGVDGLLVEPDEYPGVWEFTLDENSSFLNRVTPIIADQISQVARDIAPTDEALAAVADEVRRQLEEQLVDHGGLDSIRVAERGQQFHVRSTGDASPGFQMLEVNLHHARLEQGVRQYLEATGPTAWRARHRLEPQIRVDALALAGSARRLRRTAGHLAGEMPGRHLTEALRRFDHAVPHLVSLRDMSEHIDEYAVGAGKHDRPGAEAGPVFDLRVDPRGPVTISARGGSMEMRSAVLACTSLAACVQASVDHYLLYRTVPGFADFEFTRDMGGVQQVIAREKEAPQHFQLRQAMAAMALAKPDPKPCPHCGLPM
ncbi:MAG: hypothetical protein QOI95_27 [Acidimicrobiaceae bacterium]